MSEHICADLGELQPRCDGYYCRIERERLALEAALIGGETNLSPADQLESDIAAIIDYELETRK